MSARCPGVPFDVEPEFVLCDEHFKKLEMDSALTRMQKSFALNAIFAES